MADKTKSDKSKTLVLTGHGGYDKLHVQFKSIPVPDKDEILVNIKATGINFAELMARQGLYDMAPKCPCVLGLEASGVVIKTGKDVKDFKEGDRVICVHSFGLWTEYKALKEQFCFHMPEGMSFAEGAALPVNYVTAYQMLFDFGNLREGNSVLVHMAAGGVGVAATQLCKTVPNVTVFGTASASKHAMIRELGVTYPIDYHTEDYEAAIRRISPKGVDIVLDPLSGHDSVKGYNLLKPLGKIIHFGAANMVTGPNRSLWQVIKTYWATKNYNPINMVKDNKAACGYHLGKLAEDPELVRGCAMKLVQLYREGKIKPQIDSQWSFDEVGKAMARMHDRKNVGKVILCPHQPEDD